jgi:hypothetical protein
MHTSQMSRQAAHYTPYLLLLAQSRPASLVSSPTVNTDSDSSTTAASPSISTSSVPSAAEITAAAETLRLLKAAQDELRWRDIRLPLDVYVKVAEAYLDLDEPFYAHNMVH